MAHRTSRTDSFDASQAAAGIAGLTRSPRPDTGKLKPGRFDKFSAALASRSFSTPQPPHLAARRATRWAYNALLGRFNKAKDGLTAGTLWPSIGELAKSLRHEKPEWWTTVDWEMLDNGRRLETALKRWHQCRKGKHDWHQSGSCGYPTFHKRSDRKSVSFSSHVGDGRRVKWLDQRHITVPSIGTLTLAESRPEVGWVKQVHAVQEGWQLCVATIGDDGTLTLRLRLPDCLAEEYA